MHFTNYWIFLKIFSDSIKNNLYSEFWWIDIITSPGYLDTRKMSVVKKKMESNVVIQSFIIFNILEKVILSQFQLEEKKL